MRKMVGMDHEDLGALFGGITRRLIDAERPLLAAHGLSMWAYIVLSHLARQRAETQLALAEAIHHDKTRLIGVLDELERDGLITRKPDPKDRRARTVTLTQAGKRRHAAARADVRAMEDEFLGDMNATDRDRLLRILTRLASEHPH
jgi:DNA-binding MarR family transcriptional regulator